MDEEVPKIKPAFIKTMTEKYGDSLEHAKQIADSFIQIFLDSVNYGFSLNHSVPYSYIGYINAWLRYYYPLEFCTAGLQIWRKDEAKRVKFLDFANRNKIVILPSRFGKSKGNYTVLKSKNQIFEGTVGIKGLNETIGNKLYELSNKYTFNTFTDLLLCIYEPVKNIEVNGKSIPLSEVYTSGDKAYLKELYNGIKKGTVIEKTFDLSLDLNKRGMLSLIQLDYFSMFGNAKKLEMILEHFKEEYNKHRKTFDANQRAYLECLDIENDSKIRDYTYADKARFEFELLGKPRTTIPNIKSMISMVLKVQEYSNRVKMSVYDMRSGRTAQIYVKKQLFREQRLKEGSIIIMRNVAKKPCVVMVDGRWQQSHDKYDYWLTDLVNSYK